MFECIFACLISKNKANDDVFFPVTLKKNNQTYLKILLILCFSAKLLNQIEFSRIKY